MNNEFKNYYKILGISQNASSSSIEAAARREMEYANPFQRDLIREAASVLLNNELRIQYDAIYNERVNAVERLKQNSITQSDFLAVSSLDNRIKELEEEAKEKETPVEEPKKEEEPKTEEPEEKEEEPKTEELEEELKTEEEPKTEEPEEKEEESKTEEKEELEEELKTEEEPKTDDFKKINNLDDEIFAKDAVIKASNRKRILKNSLIIGGSTLFFGPIGTIASIAILKKKGKLKLQKLASKGRIKEIKTSESEFISKQNQTLEENIDKLLNSPLKGNQSRYKLEIAKLRYEHQVNLLAKRIEFKKEQKSQLGGKAYNRLYVLALEKEYAAAIKFLELRKKKAEAKLNVLNSYNPNENRMDRLTKIQKEIGDTTKELQNSSLSDFGKNHKLAKLNRLNTKKLRKINKMSLKKNGISRNQVLLAILNSPKNWFSHKDEQTKESIDLNSFSGKTR